MHIQYILEVTQEAGDKNLQHNAVLFEIWCHGGNSEDFSLLGCVAVRSDKSLLTFWGMYSIFRNNA
jgi:hypothetical protein